MTRQSWGTEECLRLRPNVYVDRQVALVRLCYGDASLQMVQALCDLAHGYAKEHLWPQVSKMTIESGAE